MKNDLISKSELIESLRKYSAECEENMASPSYYTAIRIVNAQPIAHDLQTVVEKIESERASVYERSIKGMFDAIFKDVVDIVSNGGNE